jgi:hypothetical protein
MKKKILVSESELVRIINKIISEQTADPNALNLKQSAITGYQNLGAQQSGQRAKQAVVNTAKSAIQGAKQVVIKIGNAAITVVTIAGAVLWIIGDTTYKVGAAISNEIIKLLSATGKVVVGQATQLGQQASSAMTKAGIALNQGADYVAKQVTNMKDSSVAAVTWALEQMKQFGVKVWAQVLAGVSAVKSLGGQLENWAKSKWAGIQNQVGVAWDQAKSQAQGLFQQAKNYGSQAANAISNKASQIKTGVSNFANKAAEYGGRGAAWLKGFMSELFNRYHSFQGKNTMSILSEARQFNGKAIVL